MADGLFDIGSLMNAGTGAWDWLTSGFSNTGMGSGGGLGGLLSGLTGSANPLQDVMSLLSFINEGKVTQQEMDYMKSALAQQTGAVNTAMDPNRLAAYAAALRPHGADVNQYLQKLTPTAANINAYSQALTPGPVMTPAQYAQTRSQLTQPLSQALEYNTLQPVQSNLAAQGQGLSPTTQQYVSQQALAPFQMQEQQMGQSATDQILNQLMQEQAMGQNMAQYGLGMGENMAQFGLGLGASQADYSLSSPFQMHPVVPDFSMFNQNNNLGALQSLLGGNTGGGTGGDPFNLGGFSTTGGFGDFFGGGSPSNLGSLIQNQFLQGVS